MAPSTNTEDLCVGQVSIDETPPFSNGSGFGLCLALNKNPFLELGTTRHRRGLLHRILRTVPPM